MIKYLIISVFITSCVTVSVGYNTKIKLKCEVMHKTDYNESVPEQKCGVILETTVLEIK